MNIDLRTPCEYLEDKLGHQRRIKRAGIPRAYDSPGTFAKRGRYPANALEVLKLFMGLSDPSVDGLLTLCYGCTCNQCLLGILSPRVVSAMLFQAEIAHDIISGDFAHDGETWLMMNDRHLNFLPLAVR